MPLTDEEKAARARQRMLDKAREYTTGTYIQKFVAPLFQKMIRAEAGADPRQYVPAVVDGEVRQVERTIGQCVCVTCGKVQAWDSGIRGMHTGHFLGRDHSIIFEEQGVAPQCCSCNFYGSGERSTYRLWMEVMRGEDVIARLERLKTETRQFSREELVDLKISYAARLKAAEERMKA